MGLDAVVWYGEIRVRYIPEQGDIVHLVLGSSGQEIKDPHLGLVVSSKLFNKIGLAMICPISQGVSVARNIGTIVTLMGTGTYTQGLVHCHQLKSMDWRVHQAQFKEKVPAYLINEVLARIEAVFS